MTQEFRIASLPGDGVGVEVTAEAIRVLRAVESRFDRFRFHVEEHPAGARCFLDRGTDMPEATWKACERADAVFLGAIGLPDVRRPDGTELAPQLDLRRGLDLYAGVRPVFLYHPEHCPLKGYAAGDVDLVIVRESTEGLFVSRDAGIEVGGEVAVDSLVITRKATRRVVERACELARARGGKRLVTCADKANAFRSYAFFRRIFDEVAAGYPDLKTSRIYIDAMALYLVRTPRDFDIIVAENLFGDILSDLAAALAGGMGMAPSGDIGDRHAVFQPAHGTAPDIAGKGIANPTAAILSLAMMLDHLSARAGEPALAEAAAAVRGAVAALFAEHPRATPDLGGRMRCAEAGTAIAERVVKRLTA